METGPPGATYAKQKAQKVNFELETKLLRCDFDVRHKNTFRKQHFVLSTSEPTERQQLFFSILQTNTTLNVTDKVQHKAARF